DLLRFADTGIAGFYRVKFDASTDKETPAEVWFAANVSSADESDITPAATVELESRPVKGESKAEEARRELWKLFAVLAFLVLMVEWWVYNRRVYV
ncbi:MAG TPA: hypothetical protein VFF73_13420, partial [Planctomycetota bacterium]|nr:hypothetical protein [Planctomycetota bacterium]